MSSDRHASDLVARARNHIREAIAASGSVAAAELPPMWPLPRPVLRAILARMVDEGALARAPGPAASGPPRFVPRRPHRPAAYTAAHP